MNSVYCVAAVAVVVSLPIKGIVGIHKWKTQIKDQTVQWQWPEHLYFTGVQVAHGDWMSQESNSIDENSWICVHFYKLKSKPKWKKMKRISKKKQTMFKYFLQSLLQSAFGKSDNNLGKNKIIIINRSDNICLLALNNCYQFRPENKNIFTMISNESLNQGHTYGFIIHLFLYQ